MHIVNCRALWYIYLFLLCLILAETAESNTYYLSSCSGDDTRTLLQAQNSNTPWRTLDMISRMSKYFQPGDSILLRSGETFTGSLKFTNSGSMTRPIYIGKYGSAKLNPIVSGIRTLTTPSYLAKCIWEVDCPKDIESINQLFLNDTPRLQGRYPNSDIENRGYLQIENHQGFNVINFSKLPLSKFELTNAEIVIRKNRWILEKVPVKAIKRNSIEYRSTTNYEPSNKFGFFFQNHISTLDQFGEWSYDRLSKKIRIYIGDSMSKIPMLKISLDTSLLSISFQSNLIFKDITFAGSNKNGINIANSTNIKLSNCKIQYCGNNGINSSNTDFLIIDSCSILNCNNNGIYAIPIKNLVVRSNLIKNIGLIPGMGGNDVNSYQAITVYGPNNLLIDNIIDSIGYNAIRFEGDSNRIIKNQISNFTLTKDDGGGIYTFNGYTNGIPQKGISISENYITKGRGAPEGTNDLLYAASHGIYLDLNSNGIEVVKNSVSECNRSGLYILNGNNLNIVNNSFFNNGSQLLYEQKDQKPKRLKVLENSLISSDDQFCLDIVTKSDSLISFLKFDRNTYTISTNQKYICKLTIASSRTTEEILCLDLQGWRKYSGDLNSSTSFRIFSEDRVHSISENPIFNYTFGRILPTIHFNKNHNRLSINQDGKLRVDFLGQGTSNYVLDFPIGKIKRASSYKLSFNISGEKSAKAIRAYFRSDYPPYRRLSTTKYFVSPPSQTHFEYVIKSITNEVQASLILQFQHQTSPILLDDMQLIELL